MYEAKIKKEIRCPIEYGLEVIGGKWKTRIICMLVMKDTLRYNELKEEMLDITDAVLSKALKELIEDDIIERQQYNEIPVRVEYSLSNKGKSVVPILEQIYDWSLEFVSDELMPVNYYDSYYADEN
ncbi:winged helix-turn-helix transcriptional regulator [Fundicoccus culcitae]|uniref:Helix-turn-helix transcriptional regulator n=1 Tax=Fundicoccus culcitae TaxID=2969821 RepID=A0ABY5P8I5_9LACT|nr:helix-turn-helix domain-containing protein [Fundicoccus culcitae]UUX34728.1 helix-turn-helix transcriptional regulator [Fundicoccus culcitae]